MTFMSGLGKAIVVSAFGAAMLVSAGEAVAGKVVAKIDLSEQRMTVTVDGWHYGTWKVSTARRGYRTPTGTWRPKSLQRMHYSKKYHNSPMPYSVFYLGGYAIHGTRATRYLGRPASHGCIRLRTANAATFFDLVKRHGRANTRIKVVY